MDDIKRHPDTIPDAWTETVKSFHGQDVPVPAPWRGVFGPLHRSSADNLVIVGQMGQSLDGRIATAAGHSHYINGTAALDHLHRLRALVDAVVIGVGTALADDPQLSVRRVSGPSPARVVIDPRGRLPQTARLLAADGTRRIVVGSGARRRELAADIEWLELHGDARGIQPLEIARALAGLGFRRILIEGGAHTVSHFLAARCLDRLHLLVAPLIIGSGPTGLSLPAITHLDDALRPPVTVHRLGDDVLFDCDLSAQRIDLGLAKKST